MPIPLPSTASQVAETKHPFHPRSDTIPSPQAPHPSNSNATPPVPQQSTPLPLPLPNLTPSPTRHQHCCLALSSTLLIHLTSHLFAFSKDPAPPRDGPDHGRGDGEHEEAKLPTTSTTRTAILLVSIGSGSGLLEALLLRHVRSTALGPDVQVYGVEVPVGGGSSNGGGDSSSLNRYLPSERRVVVDGSWDVLDRDGLENLDLEWALRGIGGQTEGVEGDGDRDVGLMFVYPRLPSLVKRYLDVWMGSRDKLASVVWAGPRADWEDYQGLFEGLKVKGWSISTGWGCDVGVSEGEGVVVARTR